MGINGFIPFLNKRVPQVIKPTPTLDSFGGKRIFVDCSIILRRSLHASLKSVLDRHRLIFHNGRGSDFIDLKGIRKEIMQNSVNPLLVLSKALKSVDKSGGIDSTFVLGPLDSGTTVDPLYINILDLKNKDLLKNLRDFFNGNLAIKFYPSLSQNDLNEIAQMLSDNFSRVQIRSFEICKKCVEFCSDHEDFVLSDDTNAIAYGAPNVIRDYFGTKEPNIINHRHMLESLGINRDQFIDFCLLLGFKENVKIPEIGPDRALEIIKRFKSLDKFLESPVYKRLLNTRKGADLLSKV